MEISLSTPDLMHIIEALEVTHLLYDKEADARRCTRLIKLFADELDSRVPGKEEAA